MEIYKVSGLPFNYILETANIPELGSFLFYVFALHAGPEELSLLGTQDYNEYKQQLPGGSCSVPLLP